MTAPRSLRDRIIDFKLTRKIFARLGIDANQYRLLLDLFETLSARLEFLGTTVSLKAIASYVTPLSIFIAVPVLARPKPQNFLLYLLSLTMFLMLWVLLEDTSHSLLNADEASVMAHQPIGGTTYVAAKLTHLLSVIAIFVPAVNALPALAGLYLKGIRWFYPLTHLLAAYLAGFFVAFLLCGVYGWLFRFVPPSRIKGAAVWMQVLVALAPAFGNIILTAPVAKAASSPWLPFRWFISVGLLSSKSNPEFPAWQAGIAVLATCGLIAFGLRGLGADYLVRASTLRQGSASPASRVSSRQRLGSLVRDLTGAPSGGGAFAFTSVMLRRDWHFRRQAVPLTAMYFIGMVGLAVSGIRTSPFVSGGLSVRTFPPMLAFPVIASMIGLMPCAMLRFTAEARGAWIFTILPFERLRPFVRGMFLSLWVPIVGFIHLCLIIPCIWFWGAAHGMLFVLFSATLASLLLALAFLLISSLPFSEDFAPGKLEDARMAMIVALPLLLVLCAGVGWLVFHSALLVAAAATVFLLLAGVVAHAGFSKLEREIRAQLKLLHLGPQHLFKEVEPKF